MNTIKILLPALLLGLIACQPSTPANNGNTATAPSGAGVFKQYCVTCHGADGRMGLNGAKILPESQLSLEERINLIHNGKGVMPPFKNLLSPAEIEAVATYTQSLK